MKGFSMTNMLDYLVWRGDIPFSASPFNEVDNIILAMLSFIDYAGVVLPGAISAPVTMTECFNYNNIRFPHGQPFGPIIPNDNNALLELTALSERFRDTYVVAYRNEISEDEVKQFSAVTFILPDNSIYVAFRGTDNSIVGWKEDFTMTYAAPTTAQICAAEYLADIAASHCGPIRLGGHSKGGNLAVYAAAFAPKEVQERIVMVYNNDGPGFLSKIVDTDGFTEIKDRVYNIVPQSSAVGILLEHAGPLHVIESTETNGIKQHNPYSWVVRGTQFNHLKDLSRQGKHHDKVVDDWIATSTPEERRKLTDAIFAVFESTGAKTLSDITESKITSATALLKAFVGLDKETRDNAITFIRSLNEAMKYDK